MIGRARILLFFFACAPCRAQPASQSPTPSAPLTPSKSPTISAMPSRIPVLCPSTVCVQYAFFPQPTWQFWLVPASADYHFIYVAIWGASGGINNDRYPWLGGYGAFAAGAVAVVPGEALRIIVGAMSPLETGGCGGWSHGGGRSSIQRMINGSFEDILSVGGGGGGAWGGGSNGGDDTRARK